MQLGVEDGGGVVVPVRGHHQRRAPRHHQLQDFHRLLVVVAILHLHTTDIQTYSYLNKIYN